MRARLWDNANLLRNGIEEMGFTLAGVKPRFIPFWREMPPWPWKWFPPPEEGLFIQGISRLPSAGNFPAAHNVSAAHTRVSWPLRWRRFRRWEKGGLI